MSGGIKIKEIFHKKNSDNAFLAFSPFKNAPDFFLRVEFAAVKSIATFALNLKVVDSKNIYYLLLFTRTICIYNVSGKSVSLFLIITVRKFFY